MNNVVHNTIYFLVTFIVLIMLIITAIFILYVLGVVFRDIYLYLMKGQKGTTSALVWDNIVNEFLGKL